LTDLAHGKTAPAAVRARSIDRALVARLAAGAIAGGWLGYLFCTGMPQLTLHVFPRTIALHAMFGGLALVYLLWLAAARRLPGGSPPGLAALSLAAAYGVAAYASLNWRTSVEPALMVAAAVLVFYALSELPLLDAQTLRYGFMLAGGAAAAYAVWVVGNDYADYLRFAREVEGLSRSNIFPPTVPRVHDVSDHPNVLAMLLTLVLPFFALGAYRGAGWERALGAAGLLGGGMALFLTLSRAGWAGAGCGLAFTIGGAWLTTRAHDAAREGRVRSWRAYVPAGVTPTALAAVAGAVVLAAGGTLAFLAQSSTRPGWLFRSSISPREDAWRAGWHIFTEHPLFGAGPNMFGVLYPQYARGNFLEHTQHAHNGFLQATDDAGLLGLAALAALAGATAYVLYRTWRIGTLEQRLLAVACAGSLGGFAAHNQLDAGNTWKAPAIALAVVGAIIVRNWREAQGGVTSDAAPAMRTETRTPALRYVSVAARVGVIALIALLFAGWWRIDRAHYDYWQGAEKFNKGEPGAIERLQSAVNADSSMMPYQLLLGEAQATAFEATGRSDTALIAKAIVHLRRAAELDFGSDIAHAQLAQAYALAGRDDDAAAEAQKTRYIARYHVPPVLVAAQVYEATGRDADAIDTYGQVISMDAGIADSNFWQGSAFRRAHFDQILRHSAIGINPCTEGSFLVRAHQTDAQAPLDGLDEASKGCQLTLFAFPDDLVLRVNFAKILMQQGRMDEAFGHLTFATDRQPDFGPARTELGRWYQLSGDIEAARSQWVRGGELDEAESVLLLGDSYPAGQTPSGLADRLDALLKTSGTSVGNDLVSILYYRMRYGRISPVATLIPGAWQQALPRLYEEMRDAVARWRAAG